MNKKDLLVLWPWISSLLSIIILLGLVPALFDGRNSLFGIGLVIIILLVISFTITFILSHIYIIHEMYTRDIKMSPQLKKSWLSWIIISLILFNIVNMILLPIFHFKYLKK